MMGALILALAAAPCHQVNAGNIRASDLAAAAPAFRAAPADSVVAHAPFPGARRVFEGAELARLAEKLAVEAEGLEPVCFERAVAPLNTAALLAAMRTSLGVAGAAVEIVEASRFPAPEGTVVFPRNGLMEPPPGRDTAVWNGYIQYDGGRFPIWTRARIVVHESRVVAAVDLKPGQAIQASQVRLETLEGFPRRRRAADSLESVVGRAPRVRITAGAPVALENLQLPFEVEKGDAVLVEVRSGGAVLKLEALAESAGRRGEQVRVRNLSSGKVFGGQVQDKGRVLVEFAPRMEKVK